MLDFCYRTIVDTNVNCFVADTIFGGDSLDEFRFVEVSQMDITFILVEFDNILSKKNHIK